MSLPKFKIGERVKTIDKYGETIEGHVVIIMNSMSDDREYYCSMYPGVLPNYYYIDCIDLCMNVLDDGKISTMQALNKFKESDLEFSDIKKIRKNKLDNLNEI